MRRVGIVAALPGELKPLVKGWTQDLESVGVRRWTRQSGDCVWLAACAGMGADAARMAFAALEKDGPLDCVASIGWAGGLQEAICPGEAYAVSEVIDVRTAERFEAEGSTGQRLLATTARVAGADEKRRLAEAYGAALVDMEAAAVARMAVARNIPFYCYKAVTDGLDAKLPDFNRFLGADGQLKMVSFVLSAAVHPSQWPALVRMGKYSSLAAEALKRQVLDLLTTRFS